MQLHIFQSDKGDCLLLESQDGRLILCDGGMANTMKTFVRHELAKYRQMGRVIDYAYVSHIDSDHISGVLRLLQDELEWRVYDHHQANGNTEIKAPKVPRPPEIKGIWHNAFKDQVGKKPGEITAMLATAAPVFLATGVPALTDYGEELYSIATSIPEAIKVSRLASAGMLGIPVNQLPGAKKPAKLLKVQAKGKSFAVGSMTLTIVGPTSDELNLLEEGWMTWLRGHAKSVHDIDRQLKRKMDEFANTIGATRPIDLGDWNGVADYEGVTVPNIASLMFMVEENGKRLLLTGDSQQDIIIKGLKKTGFLSDGGLHVDVLKVQHHGSEHNMDEEFAKTVAADHYVFCGNGEHGNPELRVIEQVFNSRLGPKPKRATAVAADRPFIFWFSTSSSLATAHAAGNARMAEVERLVDGMVKGSKGLMKARFNKKSFTTLPI